MLSKEDLINMSIDEIIDGLKEERKQTKNSSFKVYFAGKINKNDWRHTIIKGLREYNIFEEDLYLGKKLSEEEKLKVTDNILYNGPYFIGCDHGCYHGENTHGNGVYLRKNEGCGYVDREITLPINVFQRCIDNINDSDIVFVYIDSIDIYGTLYEMGYAFARQKPIYVYIKRTIRDQVKDLWFSLNSSRFVKEVEDEVEAFEDFKKQINNIRYDIIDTSNLATSKQLYRIKKDFEESIKKPLTDEELEKLKYLTKKEIGYLIAIINKYY